MLRSSVCCSFISISYSKCHALGVIFSPFSKAVSFFLLARYRDKSCSCSLSNFSFFNPLKEPLSSATALYASHSLYALASAFSLAIFCERVCVLCSSSSCSFILAPFNVASVEKLSIRYSLT